MGLFGLFSRKKSKNSSKPSSDGNCTVDDSLPPAPHETSVSSSSNNDDDDDTSTIPDPSPAGVMQWNQQGFSAYGDRSIYDGGSISSEGLTLGNQSFVTSAFASVAGRSVCFSDDSSFFQQSCQSLNMEVVYVYAPAGKLGVALDTPDDTGAPIVHYVKEASPVYGKLKVDDKLIAIDDEDVSYLTAVKISKILNRKSNNATRKLTILRAMSTT